MPEWKQRRALRDCQWAWVAAPATRHPPRTVTARQALQPNCARLSTRNCRLRRNDFGAPKPSTTGGTRGSQGSASQGSASASAAVPAEATAPVPGGSARGLQTSPPDPAAEGAGSSSGRDAEDASQELVEKGERFSSRRAAPPHSCQPALPALPASLPACPSCKPPAATRCHTRHLPHTASRIACMPKKADPLPHVGPPARPP